MSMAEEVPEPRMMTLNKGIICDTPFQVETLLTGIALNNGQFPEDPVEGCGSLTGTFPALVTPLRWYETPIARSLLAKFQNMNGYTQYGWVAYEANPTFTPASQDEAT